MKTAYNLNKEFYFILSFVAKIVYT